MKPVNKDWTVFSNHGVVLFYVIWNPDLTVAVIGQGVGLSDRWVRKILEDLETAQMITVTRRGVQNHYSVNPDARLRHPSHQHITLGDLMKVVTPPDS